MPPTESITTCKVKDFGLLGFSQAYQLQQAAVREVIGGGDGVLLIGEHPRVFTLGRLADEGNVLWPKARIEEEDAEILRIDRGGEVTFHGPGQLVIYPIFNLDCFRRDLKLYINTLEQVAIDLLKYFGIVANSIEGKRGVFVGAKKIVSIGIGVRKWVSFHGMAVNVNTDLRFFSMIKPCGLDVTMTSMAQILGKPLDIKIVKQQIIRCFCRQFNLELVAGGAP